MLTTEGCLERRKHFWSRIPDGVDWVLIGDARHVQYFSNFRINPISFSADQRCLLLLQRSGTATLLTDNFVRRTADADPVVDNEIVISWYTHKKSVVNRDHALLSALEECRERWSHDNGLVEAEGVTQAVAAIVAEAALPLPVGDSNQSFSSVGTLIRDLRRQKLPDEIELLKRCMAAGDAGHAAAFNVAKPGVTELEVYIAIQRAVELAAGCACAVYGDFRATNAELYKAGGLPTKYVLRDGDLFIADFSVIIHGYRSDFTNTIAVGHPTHQQVRQFETCRDALLAAESAVKAGVRASDVYDSASAVLLDRGYPALAHHCGHGLGLEHPETPILVPESDDVLRNGDIITIEPGLYVEGVGGMRFEHNYAVTTTGADRLSNHRISLTKS
ncbi:MAG: aminopeptidase P family protein [Fuerstiella sp.]|jgi:Xaa-Pro aminopeptidase|nr:aminopeptidase P family protein [Fuerstiella sp.]